ncbi:Thyroglobulin type-1 domain and Proteinase inhibitor I2, Kunitz metazoa domain-containing protein [Strongyloides ratti]|uniref:Thyroglobulin type-1 domain and Proteinase inhibitor I2, Kunitz metazoa domain-containing protein n=1 Tax=Strongyloides ratti TaxID=34506 RepID=A0A090L494_STRRB|nr:Thyroglobulin type-1 domain and Proteinase inhibitor I2, Kunitz metazoa domain-containing protein [Strongyloides ratti]CEF62937.1 Thyroglobulin type-1 domain and Proteinase inhibitor I2, Kunitz metazoa domain-containing protein [Strongyloides ratti]
MLNKSFIIFFILSTLFFYSLIAVIPSEGPCVLGTSDDAKNYKCTTEGYYELVQCNNEYCVCVDPFTGSEAGDTRTDPKYTPNCGKCLKAYAIAAASNKNQFDLPQCNKMNGKYEKLRYTENGTFCVDENTGEKTNQKINEYKGMLTCDDYSNYTNNENSLSINYPEDVKKTQPTTKYDIPTVNIACSIPKDAGETCPPGEHKKSERLLYYFDIETMQCLPIFYKGCKGNNNRFSTASECSSACLPMDFSACSGRIMSAVDSTGNTIICNNYRGKMAGNEKNQEECPQNFSCVMGAFFGTCCHKPTEDLFNKNYNPTCNEEQFQSSKPIKYEKYGFTTTLLGRDCSDNFCPSNSVCQQGEIFAYCCLKK